MRFENVSIIGVAHVDPPRRVTSDELEQPLKETYARLRLPERLLEPLTGVRARRFWEANTLPSDAATLAGRRVIEQSGVDKKRIGVLINSSVCRDYVEPSVACFVHRNLGLGDRCMNFDVANACLGFIDGMQIAGNMIERNQVEYALIVDGENSHHLVQSTVERLRRSDCDDATFREQLATLTVGSGAAAMLLGQTRLSPSAPRFLGGVTFAASEHNRLCRGHLDVGMTDTKSLLLHGVALAQRTWAHAQEVFGWRSNVVDHFMLHQVSQMHTEELARMLELDLQKAFLIYPELGNVGPASIPIALSKALRAERIVAGDRIVLAGIGSGLNCTAAGVVW